MTFAGIPPTVTPFGTSLLTTALAPITAPLSIVILPIILTPGPIYTLSLITADFSSPPFAPILTHACILQFFPILAPAEIMIVP